LPRTAVPKSAFLGPLRPCWVLCYDHGAQALSTMRNERTAGPPLDHAVVPTDLTNTELFNKI
ncbi:hypothetical protein, partial [Flagellimonas marinaquae]